MKRNAQNPYAAPATSSDGVDEYGGVPGKDGTEGEAVVKDAGQSWLVIILGVVGVVLGIVLGMIFMMALHITCTFVYPLPEGVSFTSSEPEDQQRLQEWFRTAPTGAWLLAIASHGLGCMSARAWRCLSLGDVH